MKEAFKTVYEGGFGEFVMKKSRFLATVCPAGTEEEALGIIEEQKKKYWDASHNCSAYIIGTEQPLMRCSDDGEPSKTAGRPMLDILLAQELTNLVVVVTRYFGGTLLGTGGLVKAYQSAVLEGLKNSTIIRKELGIRLQLETDYNLIGKFQYYIGQEQLTLLSSKYTDVVRLELLVPPGKHSGFMKKVSELTNGLVAPVELDKVYFTILDGKIHLFDYDL
ncbi:putative YigZ family protein [Anaerotaenia torta]|uniref:YigZ family protein n=1 Tax=Anaerotaenia torta TaxID=433293 RepID=UPI003D1981B1